MPITINGTTGIAGVDGSAGTPSLQGTDTNTGMFFPAADTIAFAEGGVEAMRIDSSGNVGIGTASPTGKLNVGSGRSFFGANSETYSIGVGYTQARVNSGQTYYIGATDSATPDLVFSNASGTERMRIDSSGNLLFNSGYGSVATAYGCRAWVNFNGTGTVAIRASGNVSSITDNGTGEYTINFTTTLTDANYATVLGGNWSGTAAITSIAAASPTYSTSAVKVQIVDRNGTAQDISIVSAAIIR